MLCMSDICFIHAYLYSETILSCNFGKGGHRYICFLYLLYREAAIPNRIQITLAVKDPKRATGKEETPA